MPEGEEAVPYTPLVAPLVANAWPYTPRPFVERLRPHTPFVMPAADDDWPITAVAPALSMLRAVPGLLMVSAIPPVPFQIWLRWW